MPELPEVEYAARNLKRWIRGGTIVRAIVPASRVVRGSAPRAIVKALEGAKIDSIDRRGKWLRFTLDGKRFAFNHFGMSGRWLKRTPHDETERSERLRIDVKKGRSIVSARYVDPRMFGRFAVSDQEIDAWRDLGPDPLVDGIEVEALATKLARRKQSIKEAIMDQTVIAGVGNIQATDALFDARIDPRAQSNALDRRRVAALAESIRKSIDRTIALETGPEITYVEDANAKNPFVVYGRAGERCPRCRKALVRTLLGGRATTYCPRCQRA